MFIKFNNSLTESQQKRITGKVTRLFFVIFLLAGLCCGVSCAADVRVTFYDNGIDGNVILPEPITVKAGEYITLPTASCDGRTFKYWSTTSYGFTDQMYAGDRFKVSQSTSLYAIWQSQATIRFQSGGVDGNVDLPNPITVDKGSYITLPAPVWDGHTFNYWTESPTSYNVGAYKAGDRYQVMESDTLYAVWIPKVTVVFDGNSLDVESSTVKNDKGTVITVPTATRDKYTLAYWSTARDGSGTKYYPGDSYKLSGDQTLYAQWDKNKYTVYFDSNGGESVSSKSTVIGSSITLPKTSLSGYKFTGWYLGNSYVGTEGDSYTPTASVTLSAGWEKIEIGTYIMYGTGAIGILVLLIILVVIVKKRNGKRRYKESNNVLHSSKSDAQSSYAEKESIYSDLFISEKPVDMKKEGPKKSDGATVVNNIIINNNDNRHIGGDFIDGNSIRTGDDAIINRLDMKTKETNCPRCHTRIHPGDKYCPLCGMEIDE